MGWVFQRLLLGFSLIVIASAVLLFSDLGQRRAGGMRVPRVAIFQCASAAVLDDGVRGIKDALAQAGYVDGRDIALRMFNAENDMPTANAIAKQITDGSFDLVFTVSTVCLQVVANANKAGKAVHVFGLVTDPYGAGVGISRDDPLAHPGHLVGLGSFQPVAESLRLAKTLLPNLATVGAPWNTAEHSSEACVIKARETAPKLGIKLLEANVDNSSGVFEASSSLVARGAQVLWVGCDMTVNVALDSVLAAGKKGRVPVFTNQPPNASRGALFDLGADYHEVGRLTGDIGVKILQGADPAKIPVKNVVPESLWLNTEVLAGLKEPWQIPESVAARAKVLVDAKGVHKKSVGDIPRAVEGRTYRVGLAYFSPDPIGEICRKGLFDGLQDLGFVRNKNLHARLSHAQGEIANIPTVLQTLDNLGLDLIVSFTTPVLTAAAATVKRTPVVFTEVYDPIAAGAGKSLAEHHPNITGVGSFPPVEETIDIMQQLLPGLRSVGTVYNASEANSRKVVGEARQIFTKRGIRLEELTVGGSSEVYQAAQALLARNIQAFWIAGDNTVALAFESVVKVAADSRMPLIVNDQKFDEMGVLAAVGIGWEQSCKRAARYVARVLGGEKTATIPFENFSRMHLDLNRSLAKKLGIAIPADLNKEAAAQTREVPR
jgi:ABC-type uncharacterized transport system substrate-binding protein